MEYWKLTKKIQGQRFRWYGDVERRGNNYCGKVAQNFIRFGYRNKGRTKLRWNDKIKQGFKESGLKQEDAQGRLLWKSLTHKPDLKKVGTIRK